MKSVKKNTLECKKPLAQSNSNVAISHTGRQTVAKAVVGTTSKPPKCPLTKKH